MAFSTIDAIAFDIGGVLATIDKMPLKNLLAEHNVREQEFFDGEFLQLQRGLITPRHFFSQKSRKFGISAECIKTQFEKMIMPHTNALIISEITIPYFFMSNINEIHFTIFRESIMPSAFATKNSLLSYQVGYLKPECSFFKSMLVSSIPSRILFIDNTPINLFKAQKLGMKTAQYSEQNPLEKILRSS